MRYVIKFIKDFVLKKNEPKDIEYIKNNYDLDNLLFDVNKCAIEVNGIPFNINEMELKEFEELIGKVVCISDYYNNINYDVRHLTKSEKLKIVYEKLNTECDIQKLIKILKTSKVHIDNFKKISFIINDIFYFMPEFCLSLILFNHIKTRALMKLMVNNYKNLECTDKQTFYYYDKNHNKYEQTDENTVYLQGDFYFSAPKNKYYTMNKNTTLVLLDGKVKNLTI